MEDCTLELLGAWSGLQGIQAMLVMERKAGSWDIRKFTDLMAPSHSPEEGVTCRAHPAFDYNTFTLCELFTFPEIETQIGHSAPKKH